MKSSHRLLSIGISWLTSWLTVSAAERRPDVAENPAKREEILRLNVQVPEFLGNITKEKGILLVYISTGISRIARLISDYVFDGRNPPYYPESKPKYVFRVLHAHANIAL